ncbi:glycosyltransferase family 4 protein [Nocardia shimofusensis]|uniref:glycosyltransferase family 4 protein n=1 Tax=Nocardia shimofusensis TaxID=228596 RepID=UPI00082AA946|nr:glycosyltransferase family 4 protein [Nocardia shimofusensis]
MCGSEWFGAAAGGLNRYFTDLYAALALRADLSVTAAAFGDPPEGGSSWGPVGGSTRQRVRTARRDPVARTGESLILDRHFALYGPPRGRHRLVVHFHGPWAAESAAAGQGSTAVRTKYLVERVRMLRADRFVVLSEHMRAVLADDYGVDPRAVEVIAPGVDLDRFRLAAPATEDRPIVLCVRRLENRMGIDVLLRAWPAVRAAHPWARLVVVGTGTAEPALRARAETLGDAVWFTGRVGDDELAELYSRAALTVVPSVALEGFGLIALESLAAGRAPVVTDCGGLPDSVRGLDPSLIVAGGDADALAARLVEALDGKLPDAAACRAHAETFSWAAAAERHAVLYRELAR